MSTFIRTREAKPTMPKSPVTLVGLDLQNSLPIALKVPGTLLAASSKHVARTEVRHADVRATHRLHEDSVEDFNNDDQKEHHEAFSTQLSSPTLY